MSCHGVVASFVIGFAISSIQGKAHSGKEVDLVDDVTIALQVMQDINVAMALDDIMTEILAIKRFTKCQLVTSSHESWKLIRTLSSSSSRVMDCV